MIVEEILSTKTWFLTFYKGIGIICLKYNEQQILQEVFSKYTDEFIDDLYYLRLSDEDTVVPLEATREETVELLSGTRHVIGIREESVTTNDGSFMEGAVDLEKLGIARCGYVVMNNESPIV